MPHWVTVEGCDGESCRIVNGQEVVLSAGLVTEVPANTLTSTLTGYWLMMSMKLELPEFVKNGCNFMPDGCPVPIKQDLELTTTFVVKASFDNIKPAIEFRVTTETGAVFMCVRTKLSLVSPSLE